MLALTFYEEFPVSFRDFSLDPNIQKALEACGYTKPTPVQAKAIPEILAGKDVVACAQTGTGKTAAFVLPALNYLANCEHIRKPRILVLTPTRELATQINTAAAKYGKFMRYNIVSLVGGMPYERQIRDLQRGADIIVATPGRLLDHLENRRVDLSHVEMLVLDEADRMLDMGFIEDVEAIASKTPASRQTLLFSATLDKSIAKIVKELLKDPVTINISPKDIAAPQINQLVFKAKNIQHKTRMLKHFLNDENIYKAIIFTATKQLTDRLATELRAEGFAAAALHGDLRQNVRNRTIEAMRRGKIQFLVATDVAARGLDISDITHVINFDLPKFCEDYVHRIGRTGRAGKTGEAISFFISSEMRNLQKIERYIGKRLTIQNDNFEYAETTHNTRSDAEKFSPENMLEAPRRGGRNFGDRPRRQFDNDKPRKRFDDDKPRRSFDSDKPRKRFDDDKPRRSFDSDKPRKRFDDDKPRRSFDSDKPRKRFDDDKPRRSFDSDKPRKRFDDDKPRKRFDDDKPRRSFDSDKPRKRFDDDKPRRSFDSDKPRKRFDDDKPRRSFDSDKPRKRFDEDKPRRSFDSDKPRKRFDDDKPRRHGSRDESQGESFSRRRMKDTVKSFNQPRSRFSSDERDNKKSFGDKPRRDQRKLNVFEKPVYEYEQRDDNPRVLYKKRVNKSRDDKPSRHEFSDRNDRSAKKIKPDFSGKRAEGSKSRPGKNTKPAYRDSKKSRHK